MIKPSKTRFNHAALVRGWNSVLASDQARAAGTSLDARAVLVLGEKEEEPGAFAVIWSLYDPATDQIAPVRLDATGELLRELETRGKEVSAQRASRRNRQ